MTDQTTITFSPEKELAALPSTKDPVFRSFASGVALTFATRLLVLGAVIGSSVIVGRWLGPAGMGALAVLNVTVALALQIGSAGLPSAITYFIAKDRSTLGTAWVNSIVFALVVGTIIGVAVVTLEEMKSDLFAGVSTRLIAIVAISIPFQLFTLLGLNMLLAIDRIRLMNLMDSLSSVFVFANAIIVLVIWQRKLLALVSFNTAAAILVSLLLIWVVGRLSAQQKQRDPRRPNLPLLKRMLGYGLKFYLSILASVVIFRADLLIVNRFRGANEAGVYAVATQFSLLLTMLPGVIATLLFPRVASRQDETAEYTVEVTRHASFVMLIICLGAAAASFALPMVYGHRFADATIQLLILLPGIFLISIESVLVQHFTGTGLPMIIPVFWIVTMIFNLGLNIALVPTRGARAAAVNSTLSYALIFMLVTTYFCQKTGRGPLEVFLLRRYELRDLFIKLRRRAFASR